MSRTKNIAVGSICLCVLVCMPFFAPFDGAHAEGLGLADVSPENKDICVQNEKDERGIISVTGEAKDFFHPDTAMIMLAVETTAKTASEAVSENSKRAEKVVKALKPLINSERGDAIKTSSFSVQPVYEYDNAKKRNFLTGYRARHQITVRTERIETTGRIIDSGIQSGADEIDGVNFLLARLKDYCEGVYKDAASRARRDAAFVARTLGVKISGIKSISHSCGTETPRPIFAQGLMAAKSAALPETAIEAGDIAVSASVSVVFYMEKE